MSRIYQVGIDAAHVKRVLATYPHLQQHFELVRSEGDELAKKLWPDGIKLKGSDATGWFENGMLLFWGRCDEGPLLNKMSSLLGADIAYIG